MSSQLSFRVLMPLAISLAAIVPAGAVDHVVLKRDDRQLSVSGKLLLTAQDGGLLVLAPDGVLWTIPPEELVSHTSDRQPFRPLDADRLAATLLAELPEGFSALTTSHYLILYNTSRSYAAWCGALYERLYAAFTNFWTRKGFELHEPQMPLVVLVFADGRSYHRFAQAELGEAAESIAAYYSLRTNRVTLYDLTGVETLRQPGSRRGSAGQVNQILAQPAAEPMVATIIHEATHQIAFNCGLQTRYTDVPLWVSEGIAVYFETPDLKSAQGWRGIGAVNYPRLEAFKKNLPGRGARSLESLVVDDARMRDARTAADAYAEAWALSYWLIRTRPKPYLAYLKMLSQKDRLVWDDPQTRLAEFKQFFGDDLARLDADFVGSMRKVD